MGLIARIKGHTFVFKTGPFMVWISSLNLFVDNEVLNFGLIEYKFWLLCWFLLNITHFYIFITCYIFNRSLSLLNLLLWRHRTCFLALFLALLFTLRFTASLLSFVRSDIKKLFRRRGWCSLGFTLLWFCLSMFSLCRDLDICHDGSLGCRRLGDESRLCLSCSLCFGLLSFHWRYFYIFALFYYNSNLISHLKLFGLRPLALTKSLFILKYLPIQ